MTGRALVADTGGRLRALAYGPDGAPTWPDHERELRIASRVIVPSIILAEIDHFLRKERGAMRRFIMQLFDPTTTFELELTEPTDIARAMELDFKFASLSLGIVDGVVAAVAERRRIHRILTIDHADFVPLRVGVRYEIPLQIVPE